MTMMTMMTMMISRGQWALHPAYSGRLWHPIRRSSDLAGARRHDFDTLRSSNPVSLIGMSVTCPVYGDNAMRFGCLFGLFLIILAFGIMGFFMLPLLFEGNGFTVPLIIGLVFSTRGARRRSLATVNGILGAHLDNLPASGSVQIDRRSYQIDPNSVDVNALLQQFGLSDAGGVQGQRSGGGSLTAQLKDLQTAYDKQLITKDEHDRLRQQILDNASRSS
jgi:hypothetical protein